jgi:hypothetical protein
MSICHRCGNHELGTDCTIPKSPYYVISEDTFMSGWGPATNKRNLCVVPCSTREMAERVLRYVKSRSEQKNARITTFRPGEGTTVLLTNLAEWIKTAKRNGF